MLAEKLEEIWIDMRWLAVGLFVQNEIDELRDIFPISQRRKIRHVAIEPVVEVLLGDS